MKEYENFNLYYGDLHNHCGISYGHGPLENALKNAELQLDFCSVTGHALWPDMPPSDPAIDYIRDFHIKGFARLEENWEEVVKKVNNANRPDEFVAFIGFEMHSCRDGDHTIIYGGDKGDILQVSDFEDLKKTIRDLRSENIPVMAFPHHIAYIPGGRGVNWDSFDNEISPIVEIISMHGCSENDESPRPYLHSMGPSDYSNTVKAGLLGGKRFGFIGCTDHHSAFPGSYGHGRTGLWAESLTRYSIFEALQAGRTYALTGDKIALLLTVNGAMMGGSIQPSDSALISVDVKGGGAIDYLDIVKNGTLLKRFSQPDIPFCAEKKTDKIRTKVYLELGWGERNEKADWNIKLGVKNGKVLDVEPRLRGLEIVSPLDRKNDASSYSPSSLGKINDNEVWLKTESWGNPSNSTNTSQGICIEVESPEDDYVIAEINGNKIAIPLKRLMQGAVSGRNGHMAAQAYCFHRAPAFNEFAWNVEYEAGAVKTGDCFYVRIKQVNDQWAWSSPVFVN